MEIIIGEETFNRDNLEEFISGDIELEVQEWVREIAKVVRAWIRGEEQICFKTSGSTGVPKIICHSRKSVVASARKTGEYFGLKARESAMLCLPAQYVSGQMMIIRALELGLRLYCVRPSANPLKNWSESLGFVAMTPHQCVTTLERNSEKLELIQTLILGGGPVPAIINEKINLLPTHSYHTYGMTETITHVAIKNLRMWTYYEALPGVRFEKDRDDVLIIEADHLDHGIIRTNDRVDLIDPHRFIWMGRIDFVVNSGGLKIFPEEIDKKIQPLINRTFFTIGMEDKVLTEKLVLIIEGSEPPADIIEDLELSLRKTLEPHEVPKKIYFVPLFYRTETGKIRKDLSLYNL